MAKIDFTGDAIKARLELLSRLSEAPLEVTPTVDMSPSAIRDRLLILAEVSAVCFAVAPRENGSAVTPGTSR